MAEDEAKLSEAQKQKAIAWLKQKAPNLRCPACGHPHMGVVEHLLSPAVYSGGSMIIGGPSYPQFVIVCGNCSHMMAFSAVVAGIVPRG